MTLVGVVAEQAAYFFLPRDYMDNLGAQWSGPITIYMFFVGAQKYGMVVSLLLFWRTRSFLAFALVVLSSYSSGLAILLNARRGPTLDLFFAFALSIFFVKRWAIPTWLMLVILAVGAAGNAAIEDLRRDVRLDDQRTGNVFDRWSAADPFGSLVDSFEQDGHEVKNGVVIIWSAQQTGSFDYGLSHWNGFVFGYFPGQIFGFENKKALMFDLGDAAKAELQYASVLGTTPTGMADCFKSFGYLGFIKFVLIGYVMGRWFFRGINGNLFGQIAYTSLMGSALHTISHGTHWFANMWLHMALFLYPLLYWAMKPIPQGYYMQTATNRSIHHADAHGYVDSDYNLNGDANSSVNAHGEHNFHVDPIVDVDSNVDATGKSAVDGNTNTSPGPG
jgi:hypothetical protein